MKSETVTRRQLSDSPLKLISKERVILSYLTIENTLSQQFKIEIKAHSDGLIYWCSHWELIDELVKMGQAIKSTPGPLHHYDFYLPVRILVSENSDL